MADDPLGLTANSIFLRSKKLDNLKHLIEDQRSSKRIHSGKVQSIGQYSIAHLPELHLNSCNVHEATKFEVSKFSKPISEFETSNEYDKANIDTYISDDGEVSQEHIIWNRPTNVPVVCPSSPDHLSTNELYSSSYLLSELQSITISPSHTLNYSVSHSNTKSAQTMIHPIEKSESTPQNPVLTDHQHILLHGSETNSLKDFIFSLPLPDQIFNCCIHRFKEGMGLNIYPTYFMYFEAKESPEKIFLLAARRRKKSKLCNYVITTNQHDLSRVTDGYCAKLRSNFLGTGFSIFSTRNSNSDLTPCIELAFIQYEKNIMGIRGPRRMTVLIPSIDCCRRSENLDSICSDSLQDGFRKYPDKIIMLENKTPDWNPDSQTYMLNFNGRVTHASVKNFQLISTKNQTVMQFGKVDKNIFTLDYSYPLSPLQAFGIALSSFERKLACE